MHTINRRDLYAIGEPLGESVTRRKLCGGLLCGGGGGGSSSSSSTTQNIDKRMAVGDGAIGASSENSTVTINSVDGEIVSRALQSVDMASATNGEGFNALLGAAEKLITSNQTMGENLIGQTQKAVADAWGAAQTTKAGAIDQKTMIVLAVVAAGAFAFSKRGKA